MNTIGQGTQDIALRLRSHETEGVTASDRYHLRNEAAAEIDRLRAEIAALKNPPCKHPHRTGWTDGKNGDEWCNDCGAKTYGLTSSLRGVIDRTESK